MVPRTSLALIPLLMHHLPTAVFLISQVALMLANFSFAILNASEQNI